MSVIIDELHISHMSRMTNILLVRCLELDIILNQSKKPNHTEGGKSLYLNDRLHSYHYYSNYSEESEVCVDNKKNQKLIISFLLHQIINFL